MGAILTDDAQFSIFVSAHDHEVEIEIKMLRAETFKILNLNLWSFITTFAFSLDFTLPSVEDHQVKFNSFLIEVLYDVIK
jgi:hypothetical protein